MLWLGKQAGLVVRGKGIAGCEARERFAGGVDWESGQQEVAGSVPCDLLWVRLSDPVVLDAGLSWWKRLCQQARFCIWDVSPEGSREELRKDLVGRLMPCPPWQFRTVSGEANSGLVELIKEEL